MAGTLERKSILTFHRWVALGGGLVISLVGLTGALLVWQTELDTHLTPGLFTVTPGPSRASVEAVMEAALAAFPDRQRVVSIQTGTGQPDRSYRVNLRKRGARDLRVMVDPYSARVLGVWREGSLTAAARSLHTLTVIPVGSRFLLVALSVLLLGTVAAGVALWWPSREVARRALRPWRGGLRRVTRDLHDTCGVYFLIPIVFFTATGIAVIVPGPLHAVARLVDGPGAPSSPVRSDVEAGPVRIPVDEAIRIVRAAAPDNAIASISIPANERGIYVLYTRRTDGILMRTQAFTLDQYTGAVLRGPDDDERGTARRLLDEFLLPAHAGTILGWPSRVATTVTGLALPVLMGSGTVLWLRRRSRATGSRVPDRRERP